MINNDIRITSNMLYGANYNAQMPDKKENSNFSEIMKNENSNEHKESAVNFSSFGAPAGFFADISMLSEADIEKSGLISI